MNESDITGLRSDVTTSLQELINIINQFLSWQPNAEDIEKEREQLIKSRTSPSIEKYKELSNAVLSFREKIQNEIAGGGYKEDYGTKYLKQIKKYVWYDFGKLLRSLDFQQSGVTLDDIIKLHNPNALPAYRDSLEKLKNAQIIKLNPQEAEKMKRMWGGDPSGMVQQLLNYKDPNNEENAQQVRNWAQQTVINWLNTQGWQLKEGQQLGTTAARKQKPTLDPKVMQQEGFQQALNAMGVERVLKMMGADKFVHKKQLFLEQYELQQKQKEETQNAMLQKAQEIGKQYNFNVDQTKLLAGWLNNNISFFAYIEKYPQLRIKINNKIAEKLAQAGFILPKHTYYDTILQNRPTQQSKAAAINMSIEPVANAFIDNIDIETFVQLINTMLKNKGMKELLQVTPEELAEAQKTKQTQKKQQQQQEQQEQQQIAKQNEWINQVNATKQRFVDLTIPEAAIFTIVMQKPESIKRIMEWNPNADKLFDKWIRIKQKEKQTSGQTQTQVQTQNAEELFKLASNINEYSVNQQSAASMRPSAVGGLLNILFDRMGLLWILNILGKQLPKNAPFQEYKVRPEIQGRPIQSIPGPVPIGVQPGQHVKIHPSKMPKSTSVSNISDKYIKGILEKLLK